MRASSTARRKPGSPYSARGGNDQAGISFSPLRKRGHQGLSVACRSAVRRRANDSSAYTDSGYSLMARSYHSRASSACPCFSKTRPFQYWTRPSAYQISSCGTRRRFSSSQWSASSRCPARQAPKASRHSASFSRSPLGYRAGTSASALAAPASSPASVSELRHPDARVVGVAVIGVLGLDALVAGDGSVAVAGRRPGPRALVQRLGVQVAIAGARAGPVGLVEQRRRARALPRLPHRLRPVKARLALELRRQARRAQSARQRASRTPGCGCGRRTPSRA